MMGPPNDFQVYLHLEPVDFRKQINGLGLIVQEALEFNPFTGLYVFVNKKHSQLKILWWQTNGFVLWQKRLEKDRFSWPKRQPCEVVKLTQQQLDWLLTGFDIFHNPPHLSSIQYSAVG